jgi:hypothetical protein
MFRRSIEIVVIALSAMIMTGHALAGDIGVADVESAAIRFLVGERGALIRNESYVLPLSNPPTSLQLAT